MREMATSAPGTSIAAIGTMARPEHLEPWNVHAGDYPRHADPVARHRFLLRYAILAPSSHNTQPWRFRCDDEGIDLLADHKRKLEVIDADGRQLFMSLGGALLNLRVAMMRFGHTPKVELFPLPADPDWVARVTPGPPCVPTVEEIDLFDAIPTRHTNRHPFERRPVSYQIADALSQAAADEGAWLTRLLPEQRTRAAQLIAAADREQFHDKRFRRELSEWLVADGSARPDGIPGYSKSYGAPITAANGMLVRTFDIGGRVAEGERDLIQGSPMLAVLGTDSDRPEAWLDAGQAMQRSLLLAGVHGLSASFLNQALELRRSRRAFARLVGRGFPQLVLRFGYGPPARATPRRPVDELLERRDLAKEQPAAANGVGA